MKRAFRYICVVLCLSLLPAVGISGDQDNYLSQWLELLKTGNSKEKQLSLKNLWFVAEKEYRENPHIFDVIFAALKDKDPIVREAAAAFWTQKWGRPLGFDIRKVNIPSYLIPVLQDEVPAVRAEATKAANGIWPYATQELVDALIKSLRDRDPWVRLNVVYALGELGYRSRPNVTEKKTEYALLPAFQRDDPRAQRTSPGGHRQVWAGNLRKVPPEMMEDKDRLVIAAGPQGGGKGSPVSAGEPQTEGRKAAKSRKEPAQKPKHAGAQSSAVVSSDSGTRDKEHKSDTSHTIMARSPELDISGAIAPMIEILGTDSDWRDVFVQQEVVYAFRKMFVQDKRAISLLLQKYEQVYLKKLIIQALGYLEVLEAEPALLKSLEGKDEGTRKAALNALLQLPIKWEERNKVGIIQDCKGKLNNAYPEVRMYAVRAAGRSGTQAGEELILLGLRDKNDEVVKVALEEIGKRDDEKFLRDILKFFSHSNKMVRETAVKSFQQLSETTAKEIAYSERKGTKRMTMARKKTDLPFKTEGLWHPTASGLLVTELDAGTTDGKLSALSILDKFDDERYESRLIVLLEDVSPEVRRLSSKLLRAYGTDRSVPALIKALKTTDGTVKRNALFALDIIGDERAKKPLSELRKDNDQNIRVDASRSLEKYCDPVYLDDNDPMMRAAALRCLEKRGDAGVYESALAELVARKSRPQMIAAMDILSKTKDPRVVEPLIIILKEGDIQVAGKAARLLGKMGDRRAVEPLMDTLVYLDSLGPNYFDNFMKDDIIEALTKIGDTRAVPVLMQMLKSNSPGVVDKSIYALQELKDSRAVPALISVSNRRMNTWNFVQSSTRALAKIGSPEALDHLEGLLYEYNQKDKVGYIRGDITHAIGDIKSEKTVALVARYLDSSKLLLGDIPWLMDTLIKNNHKSPTIIRSLIRVSGKTQRAFCDAFVNKFNNFSENTENPKDVANIVLATLKEDNQDSKVGGIRIAGYFYRYKRIKDQFIMKSLMESLSNLTLEKDSRVQSEANLEMKLIEASLSKNVK